MLVNCSQIFITAVISLNSLLQFFFYFLFNIWQCLSIHSSCRRKEHSHFNEISNSIANKSLFFGISFIYLLLVKKSRKKRINYNMKSFNYDAMHCNEEKKKNAQCYNCVLRLWLAHMSKYFINFVVDSKCLQYMQTRTHRLNDCMKYDVCVETNSLTTHIVEIK